MKTGVWHMTHPDLLRPIIDAGGILANPPISELWNVSPFPSFVRTVLGGVSLFQFDRYLGAPAGWDWAIPYPWITDSSRQKWDAALWLEVDADSLGDNFIDVPELEEMCKSHIYKTFKIAIIDIGVEAAAKIDVPLSSIKSAHIVGIDTDWQEISLSEIATDQIAETRVGPCACLYHTSDASACVANLLQRHL